MRQNSKFSSLFGRICNPTARSMGICNPLMSPITAFQKPIFASGGLQISKNKGFGRLWSLTSQVHFSGKAVQRKTAYYFASTACHFRENAYLCAAKRYLRSQS